MMSIEAFGHTISNLAKNQNKELSAPFGQEVSSLAHAAKGERIENRALSLKQTSDAAILQASLEVNLNSGNQPMALLLKAAIEGVNEALEGTLGPNAIQNAYESGIDVSPEATAERIVSMSTAFFGAYQEGHSELKQAEALESFTAIISSGIDQGFKDAREILDGLQVLNGDIATNIEKTYLLVQEGLQQFTSDFKTS
jgi:hypothetical protein